MLKFFSFLDPKNLKQMFARFPLPVIVVIALTVVFFLLNNWDIPYAGTTMEVLGKSIIPLILVFFFSIWVTLSVENTTLSSIKKNLFQLISLVFGVLFYFHLEGGMFDSSYANGLSIALGFVGVLAFVFFAPYLTKLTTKNSLYYQYFYSIAQVFLFGFVLWGLLFGLGALAIYSLELLFSIDYNLLNDLISNWAIISLSFITPIICLIKLPSVTQKEDQTFTLNTFTTFLIKYVLTSFVFLYFVILYLYAIKVLIHFWDWPKGEVCWLVIAFASMGYLTYLLSSYVEQELKAVTVFRKRFPIVVLPQIFMLFYAIALRIQQYDVTISRYLVVVFGIWLLVLSGYFIFSRQKRLFAIPASLVIFVLLISFWPWSVFSLPEARQVARLETNLEKAGILVEGKIVPLSDTEAIDKDLSRQIYDGIDYLCKDLDCEYIAQLFGKDLDVMGRWEIVDEVTKEIKVKWYPSSTERDTPSTFHVSVGKGSMFPIDVAGYEYFVVIGHYYRDGFDDKELLRVEFDVEKGSLQIFDEQELQEEIAMEIEGQIYEILVEKYGEPTEYGSMLDREDMIFEFSGEVYEGKLFLEDFSVRNPRYSWDDVKAYYYVSGYALVRNKKG